MTPQISVGLPTQRQNDNYHGNPFFHPIPVDERGMLIFGAKRKKQEKTRPNNLHLDEFI